MRKLIIAVALGALLLPNQALTLGLGEIEINSSLNQELDAEIELLSVIEGETESLIVNLASREEFQRAGLDRPFMLGSMKFTTVVRDGVSYIKVTTPKPVREPFLNFLVEIDWPQGHLIREYTLLLDPPIYSGRATPEKITSTSRPITSEDQVEPSPSAAMQEQGDFRPGSTAAPDTTTSETSATGTTLSDIDSVETSSPPRYSLLPASADGYRIQRGDTAWSLAERMRPDSSVSVEKMMLALLRTNPEAFIQENVNGLKRGYILRVPELSEINAVNQAEALALVRQQNALWREYRQAMASGKPIPGRDTDMKSDGAMSTGAGEGRLAIVGIDGGTSAGTDPTAMSAEELRNQLALTSEQLETERLEKEGLQSRVDTLQSQVDELEGLMTIEDREMAEMQEQVAPSEAAPMELEAMEEPAAGEEPEQLDSEQPMVEKIAEPMEGAPEALEPPAKPAAVAPPPPMVPPMAKPEPGLLEDPMILMAGGAVLLILLALVALIIKRRKSSAEDEEPVAFEESAEEGSVVEESSEDTESEGDFDETQIADEESDDEVDHDSTVVLQAAPDHEETVITEAQTVVTEAISPEAPVEEETDDVLAEADVYLAYGIYQQAEDLLQGAIKDNPDKENYRVKLCETLYAAKNAEAFETAAKEMHEHSGNADTPGWLKVASLGKDLCPDSDVFKDVDVAANIDAGAAEPSAPAEMDIDLGGDENAPEASLDFDIDTPEVEEESLELPEVEELEFDIAETDALEVDATEETDSAEEEFSLDIEASELDISDTEEAVKSDSKTSDDLSSEAGEDAFVDESLDFGIDEIESAEESSTDESDTDESDDELSVSMKLDDADGSDKGDVETSGETSDDEFFDASMNFDEDSSDDTSTEETSAEDDATMMELSDEDTDDDKTVLLSREGTDSADDKDTDDDKAMMRSPEEMDLSALDDVDEISTKLDLARAYMDMGDKEGTRSILDEVIAEGNDDQKKEAEDLLKELDS